MTVIFPDFDGTESYIARMKEEKDEARYGLSRNIISTALNTVLYNFVDPLEEVPILVLRG